MGLNIITKRPPVWRPNQPRLGKWKSLHKDGVKVVAGLPVKEQFDKEELARINNSILFTKAHFPEVSEIRPPNENDYI
jgi:hypothetical protein